MWRNPACTAATTVSSATESLYCQVPCKASVIRDLEKGLRLRAGPPKLHYYTSLYKANHCNMSGGLLQAWAFSRHCGALLTVALGWGLENHRCSLPHPMAMVNLSDETDMTLQAPSTVPYNMPLICSMAKVSNVNFKTQPDTNLIYPKREPSGR